MACAKNYETASTFVCSRLSYCKNKQAYFFGPPCSMKSTIGEKLIEEIATGIISVVKETCNRLKLSNNNPHNSV